nr:Rv2175c family DNA-binding protein [Pseudoclavibacter helvolus]
MRGTLFLLGDAGLSAHDQMVWLLSVDETLGVAPLDALVQGRKTQVRHAVQLLEI